MSANRVFVIGEAGSNFHVHGEALDKGLARACRLIVDAAVAGCDAVKFQLLTPAMYADPVARERIAEWCLPVAWLPILAGGAAAEGIEFMCTAFDMAGVDAIDPFVKRHKIASYEGNWRAFVEYVARKGKPIIMSTGAMSKDEALQSAAWAIEAGCPDLTLMHCVAAYPAPPKALNLHCVAELAVVLSDGYGAAIGYSDHTLDPVLAPVAAVAAGARCIEKHFTIDRTLDGPDHGYAVEPGELHAMVKAIRTVETMLGDGYKQMQACERGTYYTATRALQATRDIAPGERLAFGENVACLRPGAKPRGADPRHYAHRLGGARHSDRAIAAGDGVEAKDMRFPNGK